MKKESGYLSQGTYRNRLGNLDGYNPQPFGSVLLPSDKASLLLSSSEPKKRITEVYSLPVEKPKDFLSFIMLDVEKAEKVVKELQGSARPKNLMIKSDTSIQTPNQLEVAHKLSTIEEFLFQIKHNLLNNEKYNNIMEDRGILGLQSRIRDLGQLNQELMEELKHSRKHIQSLETARSNLFSSPDPAKTTAKKIETTMCLSEIMEYKRLDEDKEILSRTQEIIHIFLTNFHRLQRAVSLQDPLLEKYRREFTLSKIKLIHLVKELREHTEKSNEIRSLQGDSLYHSFVQEEDALSNNSDNHSEFSTSNIDAEERVRRKSESPNKSMMLSSPNIEKNSKKFGKLSPSKKSEDSQDEAKLEEKIAELTEKIAILEEENTNLLNKIGKEDIQQVSNTNTVLNSIEKTEELDKIKLIKIINEINAKTTALFNTLLSKIDLFNIEEKFGRVRNLFEQSVTNFKKISQNANKKEICSFVVAVDFSICNTTLQERISELEKKLAHQVSTLKIKEGIISMTQASYEKSFNLIVPYLNRLDILQEKIFQLKGGVAKRNKGIIKTGEGIIKYNETIAMSNEEITMFSSKHCTRSNAVEQQDAEIQTENTINPYRQKYETLKDKIKHEKMQIQTLISNTKAHTIKKTNKILKCITKNTTQIELTKTKSLDSLSKIISNSKLQAKNNIRLLFNSFENQRELFMQSFDTHQSAIKLEKLQFSIESIKTKLPNIMQKKNQDFKKSMKEKAESISEILKGFRIELIEMKNNFKQYSSIFDSEMLHKIRQAAEELQKSRTEYGEIISALLTKLSTAKTQNSKLKQAVLDAVSERMESFCSQIYSEINRKCTDQTQKLLRIVQPVSSILINFRSLQMQLLSYQNRIADIEAKINNQEMTNTTKAQKASSIIAKQLQRFALHLEEMQKVTLAPVVEACNYLSSKVELCQKTLSLIKNSYSQSFEQFTLQLSSNIKKLKRQDNSILQLNNELRLARGEKSKKEEEINRLKSQISLLKTSVASGNERQLCEYRKTIASLEFSLQENKNAKHKIFSKESCQKFVALFQLLDSKFQSRFQSIEESQAVLVAKLGLLLKSTALIYNKFCSWKELITLLQKDKAKIIFDLEKRTSQVNDLEKEQNNNATIINDLKKELNQSDKINEQNCLQIQRYKRSAVQVRENLEKFFSRFPIDKDKFESIMEKYNYRVNEIITKIEMAKEGVCIYKIEYCQRIEQLKLEYSKIKIDLEEKRQFQMKHQAEIEKNEVLRKEQQRMLNQISKSCEKMYESHSKVLYGSLNKFEQKIGIFKSKQTLVFNICHKYIKLSDFIYPLMKKKILEFCGILLKRINVSQDIFDTKIVRYLSHLNTLSSKLHRVESRKSLIFGFNSSKK